MQEFLAILVTTVDVLVLFQPFWGIDWITIPESHSIYHVGT